MRTEVEQHSTALLVNNHVQNRRPKHSSSPAAFRALEEPAVLLRAAILRREAWLGKVGTLGGQIETKSQAGLFPRVFLLSKSINFDSFAAFCWCCMTVLCGIRKNASQSENLKLLIWQAQKKWDRSCLGQKWFTQEYIITILRGKYNWNTKARKLDCEL